MQVYGVGYHKLQSLLKESPWFLDHGQVIGTKYPTYIPDKGIEILVGSKMEHFIGRDIFCMDGSTKILTDSGIKTLSELESHKFKVYQYNTSTNEIELSDYTTSLHTKDVYEYYEIELDNGTVLKCTDDHKFLSSDLNYVSVNELLSLIDSNLLDINL